MFLRSRGGTDPVTCLWTLDVATGDERLVADPHALEQADEDLPPQERARRERSREQAGGVVGYATDRALTTAAFALTTSSSGCSINFRRHLVLPRAW